MTMSSDRAFEVLRADILRGRHRPGRRLGEVGRVAAGQVADLGELLEQLAGDARRPQLERLEGSRAAV